MTDRVLPPDEWHKLQGMDLATVLPHLPPDRTSIIVVEDDAGVIVGCWAMFTVCHVEGIWIAPAHRGKVSVGRRLWVRMKALATRSGFPSVVTGAIDPAIHALLRDRAVALPQEYALCLQSR